jgi:hypothetical protein
VGQCIINIKKFRQIVAVDEINYQSLFHIVSSLWLMSIRKSKILEWSCQQSAISGQLNKVFPEDARRLPTAGAIRKSRG